MVLSWVWVILAASALLYGGMVGKGGAVSAAAMAGAAEAVRLCIGMAGPLCLWCGVGTLMEKTGLRDRLARLLRPLLGRLFPGLAGPGRSALGANVTANLLGLGNAATPMGIEACRALGDGSGQATDGQCRLVVMNTASIQLLPTTVAALRSSLGSAAPLDILPCVLVTSLLSVTAGLSACFLLERHGA